MAGLYRERAAAGPFAAVAEAVWSARFDGADGDWLVLPDGCVDVVLLPGGEAVVAGPATRPSVFAFGAGDEVAGVRLRPGAAAGVLGVAAWELRDLLVPAAAVGLPAFARAGEALADGRAASASALLAAELARVPRRRGDALVARAAALVRSDPSLPAGTLAAHVAVSPRQLRRRFTDHVGYGPKRFARVARLQRVVAAARARPGATIAALAADAGYADQAHLAADCRELAGRPPSALLAQRAAVA
jgi:AraC-like DNA-binding protein